MSRAGKTVFQSIGLSLAWVVVGYIGLGICHRNARMDAYEKTRNGESLAVVLKRFGSPSHIEPHHDAPGYDTGERSVCGQSCWLRLWYDIPFTFGAGSLSVDLDATEHVIDKYRWSSP
jgi:hypothetical protein